MRLSCRGADTTNWYMQVDTYEFVCNQSIIRILSYDLIKTRPAQNVPVHFEGNNVTVHFVAIQHESFKNSPKVASGLSWITIGSPTTRNSAICSPTTRDLAPGLFEKWRSRQKSLRPDAENRKFRQDWLGGTYGLYGTLPEAFLVSGNYQICRKRIFVSYDLVELSRRWYYELIHASWHIRICM